MPGAGLAILPILNSLIGVGQMVAGATIKNPRPVLNVETPDEINQMVQRAIQLASRPDAASQIARDAIQQNSANSISAVQGATGDVNKLLQAVSAIQGGENQAMMQQAQQDGANQRQAEGMVQNALATKGGYEANAQQAEFQWNDAGRFQERAQAKSALLGAGLQNTKGGIEDLVSANLYKKLYGIGVPV